MLIDCNINDYLYMLAAYTQIQEKEEVYAANWETVQEVLSVAIKSTAKN